MNAFTSALFADEAQIDQIRHALETLLRDGFAEDAADRLEEALLALGEMGHPIVPLCEAVAVNGIELHGWDQLAAGFTRLYRSEFPITAVGIDLSNHAEVPAGEPAGEPYVETNFYSDKAFPFSTASRADLVAAYNGGKSDWVGAFEDIDSTISTVGFAALNTALMDLQNRIHSGEAVDGADHDAWFIASAYQAVILHLAVRDKILRSGLPRPVAVLVGSNESFPFFDAPVVSTDEYRMVAPAVRANSPANEDTAAPEEPASDEAPAHQEEALIPATEVESEDPVEQAAAEADHAVLEPVEAETEESFGIEGIEIEEQQERSAESLPVESEDETDTDTDTEIEDEDDYRSEVPALASLESGAALRRRLEQLAAAKDEASDDIAVEASANPGLFAKLFRRKSA